jgi:hypothetical protein
MTDETLQIVSTVVALLGGSGAIVIAAISTIQAIAFNQWKNAQQLDVERVKSELTGERDRLKAQYDDDRERLKSSLSLTAFVHQTKFASLHERRVKVLANLFTKLVQAETAFVACVVDPAQRPNEDGILRLDLEPLRTALEARDALAQYFNMKRVWVPLSVCIPMDTLLSVRWSLSDSDDLFVHMRETAWRDFQNQSVRLRGEIESQIRRILEIAETAAD